MTVRIRSKRVDKTHAAAYHVAVVNSRKKHDSRIIKELGIYDPQPNPSEIHIDSDRTWYWFGVGTQLSGQVRSLLVLTSDIAKFNGKANVVSRVEISEADKAVAATEAVKVVEAEAERLKAGKTAAKAEEEAKAAAEALAEETTEAGEEV